MLKQYRLNTKNSSGEETQIMFHLQPDDYELCMDGIQSVNSVNQLVGIATEDIIDLFEAGDFVEFKKVTLKERLHKQEIIKFCEKNEQMLSNTVGIYVAFEGDISLVDGNLYVNALDEIIKKKQEVPILFAINHMERADKNSMYLYAVKR